MKMDKNPLKVLGLSPDIVRGLAPAQLQIVIDGAYKALAKIYHPDAIDAKKGVGKRALEIFEAREVLDALKNDPVAFKRIQAEFSKRTPKQKQIEALEERVKVLEKSSKELAYGFVEYIAAFLGYFTEAPAFNLRSTKIEMNDTVASFNRMLHGTVSMMYQRKTGFYEMLVDEKGGISKKYAGGEVKKFPNRRLIGSTGDKKGVSAILREIGTAGKINKLLARGSIAKVREYDIYIESAIPLEYSPKLIPLLIPQIKPNAYLISFDIREGHPFFVVEGLPTKEYFKQLKNDQTAIE